MSNRVVRDGKVAVLYSPGFGAGWFSWAGSTGGREILFDPDMVAAVETGDHAAQQRVAAAKWPGLYLGGLPLEIEWVPQGARFEIDEYDGNESVRVFGPDDGTVA